jgi:hypothetical protein
VNDQESLRVAVVSQLPSESLAAASGGCRNWTYMRHRRSEPVNWLRLGSRGLRGHERQVSMTRSNPASEVFIAINYAASIPFQHS